jgi:hypothetical protein
MEGAEKLDDDVTICRQKRKGVSPRRNPPYIIWRPQPDLNPANGGT